MESIAFTPALYTQGDNGLGSCTPQDGAVVRFSEINYHAAGKHILVDVSGTAAKDSASHEVTEPNGLHHLCSVMDSMHLSYL